MLMRSMTWWTRGLQEDVGVERMKMMEIGEQEVGNEGPPSLGPQLDQFEPILASALFKPGRRPEWQRSVGGGGVERFCLAEQKQGGGENGTLFFSHSRRHLEGFRQPLCLVGLSHQTSGEGCLLKEVVVVALERTTRSQAVSPHDPLFR